jgi:arginase
MPSSLIVIGAPTSAGAYAPGQEKAPKALRSAGLLELLQERGITVEDGGDVPGFRWRVDRAHPRAMNADKVELAAKAVAGRVASALESDSAALVLGGDCTVELGTVAGALGADKSLGLVYVDLDTDLNTPESTDDGALDWMGVAHLLGIQGSVPDLINVGPRVPMLQGDQILFFADDNSKPFERKIIEDQGIAEVRLVTVAADPAGAARSVVKGWAGRFDQLLVHVDLDVLDYLDMPLAEERRRNRGLRFEQLMAALDVFLRAPNWAALTLAELNPDHGEEDGSTLRRLAESLADALSASPRLRSG